MTRSRIIHLMIAIFLLCIEIVIAARDNGGLVRTWGGDVFVVMLIYFAVRVIAPAWKPMHVSIGVLIFAFLVEFTQAIGLIGILGLQDNMIARWILGDTFQWADLLAYVIGVVAAYWFDKLKF